MIKHNTTPTSKYIRAHKHHATFTHKRKHTPKLKHTYARTLHVTSRDTSTQIQQITYTSTHTHKYKSKFKYKFKRNH